MCLIVTLFGFEALCVLPNTWWSGASMIAALALVRTFRVEETCLWLQSRSKNSFAERALVHFSP